MIRYETGLLLSYQHLFPAMAEITKAVEAERGLTPVPTDEVLVEYARRGDRVALAFDGDELIGYSLLSPADVFLTGIEWLPFRMWAVKNGYDISEYGCTHFIYVLPSYWKQGVNSGVRETNRQESDFKGTIAHTFTHKAIEEWAKNLPNIVDTGLKGPQGDGIYILEIVRD